MPRTVVIDEVHLTIRIPIDLPDDRAEAIRGVLASEDFLRHLRRAVRAVLRSFPELAPARAALTR